MKTQRDAVSDNVTRGWMGAFPHLPGFHDISQVLEIHM
jgi:hypothetical protein